MMLDKVVCKVCHKEFTTSVYSPTQARGCAADVITYKGSLYVFGHYGSKFDTTLFRFAVLIPDGVTTATDPVCDACIHGWVNQGVLVEVADGYVEDILHGHS